MSTQDLENYLPPQTNEIVFDGVNGVDISAKEYAAAHGINLTEFLPEREIYGSDAESRRDKAIIEYSDIVIVFWDGKDQCTKLLIDECNKMGVPIRVFV